MNYQDLDDSKLFQLVQHSDQQAFEVLYDRYVNLVFSIAFTILGNRQIAEEIVQDVFLRIWKKHHTYQPEQSQLNTWLSAIARNRSIDELRKKSSRLEHKQVSWAQVDQQEDSEEIGPEGHVQHQMEKHRVRTALDQLPEEQRQPIFLAYFYGMTQQQIAAYLDQPLGTVKTRIRLGMQKLRSFLVKTEMRHPK